MQNHKKSKMLPAAIAAVALLGVCTDFNLNFSGNADNAKGSVLSIADAGAVTYASENGMPAERVSLAAFADVILLGQGIPANPGDDLPLHLFAARDAEEGDMQESGNVQEPEDTDGWDGYAAGGGEDDADSGLSGEDDDAADTASAQEDVTSAKPEIDNAAHTNASDFVASNFDESVGSDDELYLPEGAEELIDEEPAPEFYTQGVSHSSVADIQQRLMDLGFMDYSEPTMYYGSITAEAVEMFQRQHELTQDGIIGPQTKELLFSDDAKYYLAKVGMKGDDISRIQRRLYEMGYLAKEEYITGYFGDVTEAAVKQMQQNNGLAADGKVGHDTMEMLYSETAKANIISYGDKSDVVLACQERLKELGYLTTKPDGQYGNDTVAAVKQFQSRNDLVVDGFLGPTTMLVLNSSDAVANGMMIGESGDTVKRVQELLARYGYMSSSNCTGYFGEVTEAAVKEFQRKNGLSVDGNVGTKTMAKLTSGDVVKAGSSSSGSSSASSSGSSSSSSGSSSSSSSSTASASVSALLKVAKSKLGAPYVYGAKGPNSFDCSGYVYWCLNQIGIKQSYVTSYGWRTIGKYQKITSFSSIQAGDIVVVKGHVGIAAGKGMVYDASSSSGKIVYRSLGSWWKNNFICAWRIF